MNNKEFADFTDKILESAGVLKPSAASDCCQGVIMVEHNIYCKYTGWRYVASCPSYSETMQKGGNGPKQAAVNLADSLFGKGNYKLTRVAYKLYQISVTS